MRYPERERRRIAALRPRYPEFSETFALLEKIADSASRFGHSSIVTNGTGFGMGGEPPLKPGEFPLNEAAAVDALECILRTLVEVTGNADARRSLTALTEDRLAAGELVRAFCRSDTSSFERLANAAGGLDVDLLISTAELAVKPQFVAAARLLSDSAPKTIARQDRCPACGSVPELALITDALGAEGVMMAVCRLCESEWPVQRVRCLACGNEEAETLCYLQVEREAEARLYFCEVCHHYLPVADVRGRLEFAPAAERVALAHLDALAQDRGLRPLPGGCDMNRIK